MNEEPTQGQQELDPATLDAGSWGVLPEPVPEPAQQEKRAEKKTYEGIITFGVKTELVHSTLGELLQQTMQDLTALDYYHVMVVLRPCPEAEAQHSHLPIVAPQLVAAGPLTRRKVLLTLRQEEERKALRERHDAELQVFDIEETVAGTKGLR